MSLESFNNDPKPSFLKRTLMAGAIAAGALAAEGCDDNGNPLPVETQKTKQVEAAPVSKSEKADWQKVDRMMTKQEMLDEAVGILKMNEVGVPDLRNSKYSYITEMGQITEITIDGTTYYISDEDRAEFKKFKDSFK